MDAEPREPYIYQPYGKQEPLYWDSGRIWGIAGVSPLVTIRGLTRDEAEKIVKVMREDSGCTGAKSVRVERFVSPQLAWMINYIEEEGFPKEHLEALCHIVGLFNDCEESEKEIFDFAYHLYKRYAG